MKNSFSRLCVGLVVGVFAESAFAQPVLFHGLPAPGTESMDRDIDANADGFIRGRELVPEFGLFHEVETHQAAHYVAEGLSDEPREQTPGRAPQSEERQRDHEQPQLNRPDSQSNSPRFAPPFGGRTPPFGGRGPSFGPLERRPQPSGPGIPPVGPIADPRQPGHGPAGPASLKLAGILFDLLDLNRDGHLSRDEFQRLARVLDGNTPQASPGGNHQPPVIGAHGPDRIGQRSGRVHRAQPGPRPPIQQRLQQHRSERREESDSSRGRGQNRKPKHDSPDGDEGSYRSREGSEKRVSNIEGEDHVRTETNPRFERKSAEIVERVLGDDWI